MKSFDTLDTWHDEFLRQVNPFSSLSFLAFCDVVLAVELAYYYSVTRIFYSLSEGKLSAHFV